MADSPIVEPYPYGKEDTLASEHQAVSQWVEDAIGTCRAGDYYKQVDLKSLASGKRLLDAKPEQALRYVMAAVAQVQYWDKKGEEVRAQAENDIQRVNAHLLPGWADAWGRRRQAEFVVRTLMRRKLPFQRGDVLDLVRWCNGSNDLGAYHAPVGYIVRALERYCSGDVVDDELHAALKVFASRLRSSHQKECKRFGTAVEQLYAGQADAAVDSEASLETQGPVQAATAGSPSVLERLKQVVGMTPRAEIATTTIGPDAFPMVENSPLASAHEYLSELIEEVAGSQNYYQPTLNSFAAGRKLLTKVPEEAGRILLAACERHVNSLLTPADYTTPDFWRARSAAAGIVAPVAKSHFELPRDGLFDFLLYLSARPQHGSSEFEKVAARTIEQLQEESQAGPFSEGERFVLSLYRASCISGPPLGSPTAEVARLSQMIADGAQFCLVPGEVWADGVNQDFSAMSAAERSNWSALMGHALAAKSSRPSSKWLNTADKLVDAIGGEAVCDRLQHWLPLVSRGRSIGKLGAYSGDARGAADTMNEENSTCLRGLLWLIPTLPDPDRLLRDVTSVALSAYKKVPGVGPRAVKVGNAAVYVLSQSAGTDAVGQLAMLKVRVKFGTAQKEIEKAFKATAEALGLERDEIEEMGVPSYGLEEVGRREETLGDYRSELAVTGSSAQLKWFDAKGKALKSVPAKVRKECKEDLKELQQALKDIQGMLPAQRDRIDSMFLLQKSWPIDQWRERYLNHPLIGTIARRLLWCVDETAALFIEGQPTDVEGHPIACGRTAEITLWHPVGRDTGEVTGWRKRLEDLELTQPFKQAHREVYLLTDAERNTNTYSNRFAAHIIRQHQFNALCAARGWKNSLRLMVDDAYLPPYKDLPQWGLRAEFWVEGIGDEYGGDTNESGVYLRLATDQVRFYRVGAAQNYAHAGGGGFVSAAGGPGTDNINNPVSLDQIPPLVISEVMRDVDLFVGVSSVGNDPTWQDGGPQGRFRDYWHSYSFGELSGTATTRKQVLERLVPRLKIADRCSFSDRFLVVSGKKRTYKIHLGSGNILMEPNDQYLCIVPDARSRKKQDDLFLPFEGDNTLSIIISKALLLADDDKIKDTTITSQIDSH